MRTCLGLLAVGVVLVAPRAEAQQLALDVRDGRVSLDAQDVPVAQILAEWARIGQTVVVNGELLGTTAVTLRLRDLPEREALGVVLRDVAGYVLAARQPREAGMTRFNRILILPFSAEPPPSTAASQSTLTASADTNIDAAPQPTSDEQNGLDQADAPATTVGGQPDGLVAPTGLRAGGGVEAVPPAPVAGNPFYGAAGGSGRPGVVSSTPPETLPADGPPTPGKNWQPPVTNPVAPDR